jgi:predicted secreted protein
MSVTKGSSGLIKVGSSTVAEVKSYSIDETADTIESTSMGDSAKTFESSLTSFSGSVECHYDDADTTGQVAMSIGSTITLNLYPEGDTAGDTYYSGSAVITGKTVSGSHDGLVEASISFQGSGALTITTV